MVAVGSHPSSTRGQHVSLLHSIAAIASNGILLPAIASNRIQLLASKVLGFSGPSLADGVHAAARARFSQDHRWVNLPFGEDKPLSVGRASLAALAVLKFSQEPTWAPTCHGAGVRACARARVCVCVPVRCSVVAVFCRSGAGQPQRQKNEHHCSRQMVQQVRSKVFFCEPTWAPACRGYLTLATLVWLSWTAQLACCNSAHVQVRAWLSNDGPGALKMKWVSTVVCVQWLFFQPWSASSGKFLKTRLCIHSGHKPWLGLTENIRNLCRFLLLVPFLSWFKRRTQKWITKPFRDVKRLGGHFSIKILDVQRRGVC